MAAALGERAGIGAGTVLTPEEVRAVAGAGATFVVSPNADGGGANHLVLLARNEAGYRNLIKLSSRAFLEGFYYKPRMDKALLRAEGVASAPTLTAAAGLAVTAGRALTSAAFREGYCVVQDEASQIIPELLQARPGERLLDACASPGGKTLAAAAQCGPSGRVVATDVRWRRIQLLTATLARCRAANVQVVQIGNTSPFPFLDAAFDRVLIDAPCSGLGTVRRDPDIRWRREPSQFAALVQIQRDLLDRVRPLVAPAGRIVYSTCSSEPEENEDVVAAFLETAPEFSVLPLASADLAPSFVAMLTEAGYLRTTSAVGLEAFFAASLHRR
jgi:16S rRNA (cytosine967-C5)-methyltransferase